MINTFRNFNPFNIFLLAILLFFLRVGYVFHIPSKVDFVFVESFARSLVPVSYENAFSPVFNLFLASLVVFGQALLLNFVVNSYNLLGRPSFLPAVMYIVVTALFTPFLVLSPPLICNFLVIWMLFKILLLYKSPDAKTIAYDLGVMAAVGTLIYFPFIYMMVVIWIAFVVFRPFDWRDWMASILGYATVFFFLAVYYYLNDRLGEFYTIFLPLGTKFPNRIHIHYNSYLVLIPVILIFILCFFKLRENFFKSYVLIRKAFQLLFILFIIAGLAFYVKTDFRISHFLLCAVPAAVFLAYYFLYAKKRWFYESLFILLLISIIYFEFNTF